MPALAGAASLPRLSRQFWNEEAPEQPYRLEDLPRTECFVYKPRYAILGQGLSDQCWSLTLKYTSHRVYHNNLYNKVVSPTHVTLEKSVQQFLRVNHSVQ